MIDYTLYKLNRECIKTFSEIKIKYLSKNKEISNLCHEIINILKAENKEFEYGQRNSGKDNTNKRVIKWHGNRDSK